MSQKVDNIITNLKELTLLESVQLISIIEETFSVNASTDLSLLPKEEKNSTKKVTEKTEFNIVLTEVPKDKKISILKVIRSITGLGLKEAKSLVDSTPKIIKESLNKETAESIKKQIEEVGGIVSLE
uniref:Ribosomal protein L12 n=1 Tax=Nitzschia sp. NIES-3576 TaxID=2083273 RepID=A0A2Z5ZB76_9STRA|nr:ribosomal protein L12 [Nitzschia sp. NIES-3576]